MKSPLLFICAVILCLGHMAAPLHAGEESGTFRILGLGTPDRQDVLREIMEKVTEVQITKLDFDKAEVTVRYDVVTLFPGSNPKKPPTADAINQRLDERVRQASLGGFSLKPLGTLSRDQLQRLEIKIMLPDCRGCRLGTYYAIAKLDGVEQVNFITEPSHLVVWIDPSKTNRDALVDVLKKARVGFPPDAAGGAPAK